MERNPEDLAKALGKKLSRRDVLRSATLAGIGLAGVSLVGCSTEEAKPSAAPTSAPAATPAPAATAAAATPTPAPKRGGRLHIYGSLEPPNLDPMISGHSIHTHWRVSFFYNKLVKLVRSASDPYKADIVPDLAEKWDMSSDGLIWTFHLRKGVKWANKPPMNGREFTADDVVYTFDRGMSPEAPDRARYVMVDTVEKVDKYTVKFKLKYYDATFINNLAGEPSEITPKEAVEQEGDLKSWGSGTGPFIMTKYEPAGGTWYDKNSDHFLANDVFIDGLDYLIIKDKAGAIASFRSGQLDILGVPTMHALSKSDKDAIVKSNPGVKVTEYYYNGLAAGFTIRAGVKPLDDVRVRKAINHALDRKALMAAMVDGEGVFTGTFPHHVFPDFALPKGELEELLKYDPALSKKLLAEAGFPNGLTIKIMWRPDYRQVLDVSMAMLKEVGINLDTSAEQVDYPAWTSKVYVGGYAQMAQFGYTVGNIFHYMYGLHHSLGNRNGPQTKLAEIDAKVEEAMKSLDVKKQVRLVQEVERWALTEGLYIIPFYADKRFMIVQPWVQNFNPGLGAMLGVYTGDWLSWVRINK